MRAAERETWRGFAAIALEVADKAGLVGLCCTAVLLGD